MQEAMDAIHKLTQRGLKVFPIISGTKEPAIKDYANRATSDYSAIQGLCRKFRTQEVGMPTDHYLVVDIDIKTNKKTGEKINGEDTVFELEHQGYEFPITKMQKTPSGGRHLVYRAPFPVKQGVDVLGPGLDIRGKGGYIKVYDLDDTEIVDAPQWMVERCKRKKEKAAPSAEVKGINYERALKNAKEYLEVYAPLAVEGDGGDHTTYKVACVLKDHGVDFADALYLMAEHWNERCEPPWDTEALKTKIHNAYSYGMETPGAASVEANFEEITESPEGKDPIERLNAEFALVIIGGKSKILWETKDKNGVDVVKYISLEAFKDKFMNQTLQSGKGVKPLAQAWLHSPKRRSYDGVCFSPRQRASNNYYNVWKRFTVSKEIKDKKKAEAALKAYLQHVLDVCDGDKDHAKWLIGFFAHLIQKPWEKPLVALALKGKKGVGKNALLSTIGNLIKPHYLLTDDREQLLSRFNGHLENMLLFVLDEAFWSGDKKAESRLKGLITGEKHNIERKGLELYTSENLTRIAILGNEDWVVPASHDERRYAVFDIQSGNKPKKFFVDMLEGLRLGGDKLLLEYLQKFDLGKVDIGTAPNTIGLYQQKIESLPPLEKWWQDSLHAGYLLGGDSREWPKEIYFSSLIEAYYRYLKMKNIRSWVGSDSSFSRSIRSFCKSVASKRIRTDEGRISVFEFPSLKSCQKLWDEHMRFDNPAWGDP